MLDAKDTSNRALIRNLISDSLAPIFDKMSFLQNTDPKQITDWLNANKTLTYSIVAKEAPLDRAKVGKFFLISDGFDKRFSHEMTFLGFWSWRETSEFEFGLDASEVPMFRSLAASIYFIISQFNEHDLASEFEDAFSKAEKLYTNHSAAKLDFAYLMDSAFISYFQSISMLNVRPEGSKYSNMSNTEWLSQLLRPQPGERISLVEKLSLKLRPTVLGTAGVNLAGVAKPLVEKDGKLVFSDSMLHLFEVSNQYWELKAPTARGFELGLGCPAGMCPHNSRAKSSVAIFSEILLHTFAIIDAHHLPGSGYYRKQDQMIYNEAEFARDSMRILTQEMADAEY